MFAYIKFLTSGTDMVRSPEVLKSSLFKFPVSKVSSSSHLFEPFLYIASIMDNSNYNFWWTLTIYPM